MATYASIRMNNEAVRLQEENLNRLAVEKLCEAMFKLRGGYPDHLDERNRMDTRNEETLCQSQYDEGMGEFLNTLTISANAIKDDSYVEAVIAFNKGICYSLLNESKIADDCFADAHCILSSRSFYGSSCDRELTHSLIHLNEAHNHYKVCNFDEAMDSYLDSINKAKRERDNPCQISAAFNCMGVVLFHGTLLKEKERQGNIDRVLSNFNDALTVLLDTCKEGSLIDKHSIDKLVATIVNNIGRVRYCDEDYSGALRFLKKAYSIRRSLYGDTHVDVAVSSLNLGQCLHHLGDKKGASAYYNNYVRTMGKHEFNHYIDDYIELVAHIAAMYQMDNDHKTAIFFFKIALECASKNNDQIHPKTISKILNKIGASSQHENIELVRSEHNTI